MDQNYKVHFIYKDFQKAFFLVDIAWCNLDNYVGSQLNLM